MPLIMVFRWLKKLFHYDRQEEGKVRYEEDEDSTSILADAVAQQLSFPRKFSYRELQSATSKFMRRDGNGKIAYFEGRLHSSGERVVVKRIEITRKQSKDDFMDEVMKIGSIQHRNLVTLQGFCFFRSSFFLVYSDYVYSKSSLDKILFSTESLSWISRMQILLDVAKGLAYLHANNVLHLDLKPENIYFGSNFRAKICDFGFSNLATEKSAMGVRGTPGYMAPEWLQMRVSEKTDVYSFGILTLEVVSGKKTIHSEKQMLRHLGTWAFQLAHKGRLLDMVDARLLPEVPSHSRQIKNLLKIGLWCIQADARIRPSMLSTVKMLEEGKHIVDPPLPPLPREDASIDMDFSLSVVMEMMQNRQDYKKKNSFFRKCSATRKQY